MKFLFLLLFLAFGAEAYSPGGVMLCGKKPTLYAFYEGGNPHLHNMKLWKDDKKIKRDEYIVRAMTKLKGESPVIYNAVLEILRKLQILEVGFITHMSLPEIPFVDQGCTYQEIANRQYDNKFLFVDMDLWPRMTPMGQAGVIIQEAFFGFFLDTKNENYKQADPDFGRKFVAKLFSDEPLFKKIDMSHMSAEEKKNATMTTCSNQLTALSKGIDIYINAVKLCKEAKDKGSITAYGGIKKFLQNTINECQSTCFWDEAVETCSSFQETIDKHTACD